MHTATIRGCGVTATIWPFTAGIFEDAADPINVVFAGKVDPLSPRAALLSIDGDRSAFGSPSAAPFNGVWADAIGAVQDTARRRGGPEGAVQLDGGGYGPLRFHLRLFHADEWTIGGAHFEVLIPRTADHEALSWKPAEQLVTVDSLRAGVLDPAAPVNATSVEIEPAVVHNHFQPQYDQIGPHPFCSAGPQDFVQVLGPVTLSQTVRITMPGDYAASSRITGSLEVSIPESPAPARTAAIERHIQGILDHAGARAGDRFEQILHPADGPPFVPLLVSRRRAYGSSRPARLAP